MNDFLAVLGGGVPTSILAIIDRSGSMSSITGDAIGGFNAFLADQQEAPGLADMTIVLFDDEHKKLVDGEDVRNVAPLNRQTYVPRGMTAMHDAICQAVGELLEKNPQRAVVAILTDGEENASRTHDLASVQKMLAQCRERGWEVVFLAANQDALKEGAKLGATRSVNFAATGKGVRDAYSTLSASTTAYRSQGALPPPPK